MIPNRKLYQALKMFNIDRSSEKQQVNYGSNKKYDFRQGRIAYKSTCGRP